MTDLASFFALIQVEKNINNMTIKMPHQMFVNGEFIDAEGGKTYKSINPTDGTVKDMLTTTDSMFIANVSVDVDIDRLLDCSY